MSCLYVSFPTAGWRIGALGTTGPLPIELGTSQNDQQGMWFGEFWRVVKGWDCHKKTPIRLSDGNSSHPYILGVLELPRTYSFFLGCSKGGNGHPQPEAVIVWSSLGGGGVAHGHGGDGELNVIDYDDHPIFHTIDVYS